MVIPVQSDNPIARTVAEESEQGLRRGGPVDRVPLGSHQRLQFIEDEGLIHDIQVMADVLSEVA